MLVAFPQMGNIEFLLSDLLNRLDVPFMTSPITTEKTVMLGSRHAPEFACLPFKINVGNFIQCLENGADTLIMAGGRGPCRFGYYAEVERRILQDAGYDFEMVVIEPPAMGVKKFLGPIKHISGKSTRKIWRAFKETFPKASIFDELEKITLAERCFELEPGSMTKAYKRAKEIVARVVTPGELEDARREALAVLDAVPKDRARDVLRIGIVGEFFILLEPFVNFDVEEWLGARGVSINRSVYVTDWIGPSTENPTGGISDAEIADLARPYLGHFVGGEGLASVGHTIAYAKDGLDGVIHMFPFTCMPETIAKAILPRVSRDHNIPVIHFTIDEQTGKAGVVTRLEAFIDLLRSRKRRKAAV